jgi:hypothetical protein
MTGFKNTGRGTPSASAGASARSTGKWEPAVSGDSEHPASLGGFHAQAPPQLFDFVEQAASPGGQETSR